MMGARKRRAVRKLRNGVTTRIRLSDLPTRPTCTERRVAVIDKKTRDIPQGTDMGIVDDGVAVVKMKAIVEGIGKNQPDG